MYVCISAYAHTQPAEILTLLQILRHTHKCTCDVRKPLHCKAFAICASHCQALPFIIFDDAQVLRVAAIYAAATAIVVVLVRAATAVNIALQLSWRWL